MKATMSIDPTLIQMLGRKLYSTHSIPIIVRELLQNSIDACKRQGVDPQIAITVTVNDDNNAVIECVDNGCGMTEDELINDFLCLGGSSKRGTDSTGKFGIAKAAIMSGSYWSVHTLDNYISIDDLVAGNEINKVEFEQGTKIQVVIEAGPEYGYLNNMIAMIYFSDVDIKFKYTHHRGWSDVDDEHAGLNSKLKSMIRGEDWEGSTIQEVPSWLSEHHHKAYVRLNKLVQFSMYASRLPEGVFIADVDNVACDPSSEEYPFTMSREDLSGDMRFEVRKWLQDIAENPISARYGMDREEMETSFIPGKLCRGSRKIGNVQYSTKDVEESMLEWKNSIQNEIKHQNSEDIRKYIDNTSSRFLLKLYEYKEKDENAIDKDARILSVWRKLISMVLPEGFEFGLGLNGTEYIRASHEREYGVSFFAINPILMRDVPSPREAVTSLWISACHEVAHVTQQSHDENFVSMMSALMEETTLAFLRALPRLEKELGVQ